MYLIGYALGRILWLICNVHRWVPSACRTAWITWRLNRADKELRRLQELERKDRIRNPAKYKGK